MNDPKPYLLTPYGRRRLGLSPLHEVDEHVFQVGLANFQIFHPHTRLAQYTQVLLDLGRVLRRQFHHSARHTRTRGQP